MRNDKQRETVLVVLKDYKNKFQISTNVRAGSTSHCCPDSCGSEVWKELECSDSGRCTEKNMQQAMGACCGAEC
jgi:hypothetical protein